MEHTLLQIGFDLSLFTTLNASSTPVTLDSLVQKTGAAPNLLRHFLRAMASFGFIQETPSQKDSYNATRLTRVLSNPNVLGANIHMSSIHLPVIQVLPAYLKAHKYQDINDIKDLPFHQALGTDLAPFDWMKQRPEQIKSLGHVMALDEVHSWVFSFPIPATVGSFSPAADSALLVDIGGGMGQHAGFFKKQYPDLPGRIVVQDLPATLAHAPKIEGVEFAAHDFFTPQPIQGAKFYYMRHILHDWTDEECLRIFKNIVSAMGPESLIVIEELVLPETNQPWQVAMMDIMLMGSLGGIERTKGEWESLLTRAGLRIVDCLIYDEVKYNGVITAVPKVG